MVCPCYNLWVGLPLFSFFSNIWYIKKNGTLTLDITRQRIWEIVKTSLKPLNPKVRTHSLRHWRITHLADFYNFDPYEVVVYAGWNNWGYGNMVVINHGNGWQTLYAHLSAIYVSCGQSVWQTNIIGAIGTTGNSSGPHLHFEMMYNGAKVNPHNYLP